MGSVHGGNNDVSVFSRREKGAQAVIAQREGHG
jgi:hypothetical protein